MVSKEVGRLAEAGRVKETQGEGEFSGREGHWLLYIPFLCLDTCQLDNSREDLFKIKYIDIHYGTLWAQDSRGESGSAHSFLLLAVKAGSRITSVKAHGSNCIQGCD